MNFDDNTYEQNKSINLSKSEYNELTLFGKIVM